MHILNYIKIDEARWVQNLVKDVDIILLANAIKKGMNLSFSWEDRLKDWLGSLELVRQMYSNLSVRVIDIIATFQIVK